MNEKFFDLAREKQDRMINGAVEIFAKNGYRHASTDDMVKAAGISKGLWFHYFGSKEGIYVFVYDYCVKYMLLELSTVVDSKERDYFELIRQIVFAKTRVYKNYPYLNVFLDRAVYETEQSVVAKTAESKQSYDERMEGIIKSAELGNMLEPAKWEQVQNLLNYAINGIMQDMMRKQANAETMYKEVRAYIELVRDMARNLL